MVTVTGARHPKPHKRAQRRGWPVSAYVGANGGGKTAAMVYDTLPSLEAGRPVLSTVRLLDYADPRTCDDPLCEANPASGHYRHRPTLAGKAAQIRNAKRIHAHGNRDGEPDLEPVEVELVGVHQAAHPLWIPWTKWEQLLTFQFGDVLADEMTGVASSRDSMALPSAVVNHFQQLRRDDIPFRYTCPDWARTDKSLREPTQTVTVCEGYLPTPAVDDRGDRVWKQRRLFKWKTYDARALDSWTEGKSESLKAEVSEWHYGPGSAAFAAYDTFDAVLQVGTVTEAGRCHRCGGTRRAPQCRCEASSVELRVVSRTDGGAPLGVPGVCEDPDHDQEPAPVRGRRRSPAREPAHV